jgi:hypothetical protein
MGSRRASLGRLEALIENLKRSIDWNGATLTDVSIQTSQNCLFQGSTTAISTLTVSGESTLANTSVDGALSCAMVPLGISYIADAANDTTITTLESGKEYWFGTADGVIGASDGDNSFTFKLPTPVVAGERIRINAVNAAAYSKLVGFVCTVPASETIRYFAYEAGEVVESGTTVTGTAGSQNVFVKLNASHFKLGDVYECISLSTTKWLVRVIGGNGLIASGDIGPAAGNASGYIN